MKQRMVALMIVVIVWAFYGIVVWASFPDWQRAGVFGDAFGALNALFSGLAFLVIAITLMMQHNGLDRVEKRHQQLLEAHNFAIEMRSKIALFDHYQLRYKWALEKNMKELAIDLERDINDSLEQIKELAEGAKCGEFCK